MAATNNYLDAAMVHGGVDAVIYIESTSFNHWVLVADIEEDVIL